MNDEAGKIAVARPDDPGAPDPLPRIAARLTYPAVAAILLVAVALVWGRSVTFGFVWDDRDFIERLPAIRSLRNVPAMFYDINAQAFDGVKFRVFRPLRTVVYALLYQAGGGKRPRPAFYHAANLGWHAAAVLIFYFFVLRLLESAAGSVRAVSAAERRRAAARIGAFAAAFGAAVHPLASEVVCWCKSLDDLMATTFVLGAVAVLVSRMPLHKAWPLSVLLYALALYSKVSALPAFVIAALILYCFRKRPAGETLLRTAAYLAVAGIYLFHRYGVIGRMEQIAPMSGSWFQTVIDTIATGPTYARLFLGIPPFCIDYDWWPRGASIWNPGVLGGVALGAGSAVLAVRLLFRRGGGKAALPVGLGLAWILCFLLPVSNIVPMMQYIAERFAYLPLYGAMVVFGFCIAAIMSGPWRRVGLIAFGIPVIWALGAFSRAAIWRDELTLFFVSADDCPSARIRTNAVRSVLRLPNLAPAFQASFPPDKVAWEKVEKALEYLRDHVGDQPDVLAARAIAALRQGRLNEAAAVLDKLTRDREGADSYVTWYARSCLDISRDDLAAARRDVLEALRRAPRHPNVLFLLVCYYTVAGNERSARRIAGRLENPEEALRIARNFVHDLRKAGRAEDLF